VVVEGKTLSGVLVVPMMWVMLEEMRLYSNLPKLSLGLQGGKIESSKLHQTHSGGHKISNSLETNLAYPL